jgi:lysophospholipase L1-like esterase
MSAERVPARRHIRLKEWRPNLDTVARPPPDYLAATDGSLADADYRMRTDAAGFILPPASAEAPDAPAIFFFGDSFVESTYVAESERFPAAVQARLLTMGRPARCLNAGYSGATTLHLLLALLAKVGPAPGATVCLVVPSNDALALVKEGGFWTCTDKRYAPVIPVPEVAPPPGRPLDLADLEMTLRLFADACGQLRLRLLLATFPHRTGEYGADPWLRRRFKDATNYARILGWRRAVNDLVRKVAGERSVPLIDLDAALSAESRWFYDDLHMNAAGSRQVAELLAEQLAG